ncbi:protein-L-isoaspartate(D-aspartate) O-methyltransferase [Salsuginibacillus kocurii]|uniref:protein-L-isoaspartate(D-aspartate) O-methyltransferase n=1 Tax=Salsuginibacillus kocurii TaxID=427078 RepID=UPI00037ABDC8|nr:protein-L-isoaspartate(D-aspartate) O-methyltransferase [Salsuginibacillus kocurii]
MSTVENEIIQYFQKLDRSFYMETDKGMAHMDQPVSIGHGQTISQPSLVLKMTLLLDVYPEAKVLEVGTGSGFQTDVLASFSKEVYTVERIEALHERAKEKLAAAGYHNVKCKLGDGSCGWKEYAPYDRIIVTAAASKIPPHLIDQLAFGGKMLIPVGTPVSQELTLVEKDEGGEVKTTFLDHVVFVKLQGDYDEAEG